MHRLLRKSSRVPFLPNSSFLKFVEWKGISTNIKQYQQIQPRFACRNYSISISQMEDRSNWQTNVSIDEKRKQQAIKIILQKDSNSGRYKERIMKLFEESGLINDDELIIVYKHLYQKNYYRCIMDLTDVLHLFNRVSVLKESAELIIKAASVEKNIRIASLMATLLSPNPFSSSIYSTQSSMTYQNPILRAQQISTLFAVKKLDEGKALLEKWPHSYFANPIVLSSLLTGLVDGEFYKEAIQLYDWCTEHVKTSSIQANLRTSVTVSSMIKSCKHTQQLDRATQFFEEALVNRIVLTKNDFVEIIRIYDTSTLWRNRYKELIQLPMYKDRSKRQALQVKLLLDQLYKGVAAVVACDKEYRMLPRLFNSETESFYIDGSKLSSTMMRMHFMLLLFSYPHLYSHISKGSVYLKINRTEEKQQAFEKLLSSDLYPPIQYDKEEQATFFGGGNGKVSSISYSIPIASVKKWCTKNNILKEFPLL